MDIPLCARNDFKPLQGMVGIWRYFQWAGFRAPDLVLHVIETDDQFREIVRAFMVDFSDLSLPTHRPDRPHRYERLRVRSAVFRHVLRHGLSWQELGTGFQVRCFRVPDVHNHDLWSHFQEKLPASPLPWNEAANDLERTPPPLMLPLRRIG
jgi:CMP-N-acetylneuraminate monooxygenase